MDIEKILDYYPIEFGEHSIDSVLHRMFAESNNFHEVFCNPPGGAWTNFDLIHPKSKEIYRWDHIPRYTPNYVKLPDQVVQNINHELLELIFIESKKKLRDLDSRIGRKMIDFFNGSGQFSGISQRPSWHKLTKEGWKVLPEKCKKEERYWLKNFNKKLFWKAFAFSHKDEISDLKISDKLDLVLEKSDVDIAIYITWGEVKKLPNVYIKCADKIKKSSIWSALSHLEANCNSNIVIL